MKKSEAALTNIIDRIERGENDLTDSEREMLAQGGLWMRNCLVLSALLPGLLFFKEIGGISREAFLAMAGGAAIMGWIWLMVDVHSLSRRLLTNNHTKSDGYMAALLLFKGCSVFDLVPLNRLFGRNR